MNEEYPSNWIHATIHLNPETGEITSDGDHRVRYWIESHITRTQTQINERWVMATPLPAPFIVRLKKSLRVLAGKAEVLYVRE